VDRATGRFGHHVRAPVLAASLQISSRSICRAIAGLTPLAIVFCQNLLTLALLRDLLSNNWVELY
jgi:hypothetical protein